MLNIFYFYLYVSRLKVTPKFNNKRNTTMTAVAALAIFQVLAYTTGDI
jgi:hypothetical protein